MIHEEEWLEWAEDVDWTILPVETGGDAPKDIVASGQDSGNEIVSKLEDEWLWTSFETEKLKELLWATKLTKQWDFVPDNTTQLEALKLLMKLKWRLREDQKRPVVNLSKIYVMKYPDWSERS